MTTLRIHVLSDLHLEMRRDWRKFVDQIPSDIGSVIVLAGDIVGFAREGQAAEMLGGLRKKATHAVMVLGNHEFYGLEFTEAKKRAARVCQAEGIHLLDASIVELDGQRFVGGTLWFPERPDARPFQEYMSDFQVIEGFQPPVYEDNRRCTDFLATNTRPGDVVVTHHLPSNRSVAPPFKSGPGSLLNPFFVCDCEEIIGSRRPAVWIHGHTHVPCDYQLGTTRVVCNPIGYPREDGTGRLDFVVDVSA